MRILILGADGMIGHKMAQSLEDFELILASRKSISLKSIGIIKGKMVLHNLITDSLDLLLDSTTPDIIINCAGITTRRGVEDNIVNIFYTIVGEAPESIYRSTFDIDKLEIINTEKILYPLYNY